jgi:tRNA A37 threonylcarbamoyladenosine biosynthesis protein TsaE
VYKLAQLIRRYVIFRAKEVDKDMLTEEVARLKEQIDLLTHEKAEIFAMKMDKFGNLTGMPGARGLTQGEEKPKEKPGEQKDQPSRFVKLKLLDDKYTKLPNVITMRGQDTLNLSDICEHFINFAASQLNLYYEKKTAMMYLSGMATSKIMILEGISGTGKTSLPYAMGKFFSNPTEIVSVQPSWRDRAELLGYLNEFTKRFNETDFLARLYEATYREDLNFIVLDEMNLARIEYYFAEFLSIMEMPDVSEWKIDLVPSPQPSDPKNLISGKILVPQNIWFIGTANQDDSTFTVTDKVYDRAVSISLNKKGQYFDAPLTDNMQVTYEYIESLFNKAQNSISISPDTMKKIGAFDEFMQAKFKLAFGNRILKQFRLFIPVFIACGGDEIEALDFMVVSKILRKLTALNLVFLTKELEELSIFLEKQFGRGKFELCQDFIKQLQKNI